MMISTESTSEFAYLLLQDHLFEYRLEPLFKL